MEKISKHIGDLLMTACRKFKENFWNAMAGVIVFLSPFFMVFALQILLYRNLGIISTTFGWLVIIAFANVMVMGLIAYFNDLFAGKNPSPLKVFSGFASATFPMVLFLGICMILLYSIGTVLFIVPAFFLIANFSMVFFFIAKYNYVGIGEAMSTCRRQLIGNRVNLVIYKLFYYLVYLLLLLGVAVYTKFVILPLIVISSFWAILLVVLSVIVVLVLFALLTALFHITNHIYFEEILAYSEKKVNKAVKTEQPKVTSEEVKVEEAKPATATKPATKTGTKPAAAKPATAPKSEPAKTTAAKSEPAKPAAKKPTAPKK